MARLQGFNLEVFETVVCVWIAGPLAGITLSLLTNHLSILRVKSLVLSNSS